MKTRFDITAALLIVFLALQISTAKGQGLSFISLSYSTAVKPINASVLVSIHSEPGEIYKLEVKSVSLKKVEPGKSIDRELVITAAQYNELVRAVLNIKQSDIINGPYSAALDGEECSISYGTLGSSISFQVSNPTLNTDKRKLNDFLKAYELILRTANLNPRLILG
jgi:hypothetical protein